MKKTRFIAIVLAIAVMLIGAGYAAWEELLKFDATISTGELNVIFNKESATTPRIFYLHNDNPWKPDSPWNWRQATGADIAKASLDAEDQILTYTFTDMYPGTRASGRYLMENVGSIPAVVQNIEVRTKTLDKGPDERAHVLRAMTYTGVINVLDKDGNAKPEGHFWSGERMPLADLEDWLNDCLQGVRLQPGDRIVLTGEEVGEDENGEAVDTQFNFEIPYDSLKGDAGENESVQIVIKFNFVQHNMYDPTPEEPAQTPT